MDDERDVNAAQDDPATFFRSLVAAFGRAGLAHMLVGSFASGIHGLRVPRTTWTS